MRIYKENQNVLHYDDVAIVPQYSEITSRKTIDCSVMLGDLKLEIPVLSANMDTITGKEMCVAMFKNGGLGVMHRFMPIQQNVEDYKYVRNNGAECFVSVGVTRDSEERFDALLAVGAKYFCIDIAHGHHVLMKNMIELMRNKTKGPGKSIYIMAGNVGTEQATINLAEWGADCLKVGLSNSKVCRTKHVTGVSTPMISTISECVYLSSVPIIADSGIISSAHAAKAIGAGASLVMCGSLFAGCEETPPVVEMTKNNFMEDVVPYRGNASRETMKLFRKPEETPTPEGVQIFVKRQGPAAEQLFYIRDGLKSAMSYSNATSIKDFHDKVQFQIIKGVSQ